MHKTITSAHPAQASFRFASMPPLPDPALVAIADCKHAWEAYGAALSERDDPETSDEMRELLDVRATEVMDLWDTEWHKLLSVTPTTVAGAAALAGFLAVHSEDSGREAHDALSALAASLMYFASAA